ncbi:benzoate 4-monooxygenase cytochrome P450 [Lipomyces tetrasporus]
MTFSKKYGFLDEGQDVGGMLGAIANFLKTVAPVSDPFTKCCSIIERFDKVTNYSKMTQSWRIPWLDKIIYKYRFADAIRRAPGLVILRFVANVIKERRDQRASGQIPVARKASGKKDFLNLDIQDKSTELPPWCVTGWTFSNVIAGSDSVGTCMRTTVFNLLGHPHTLARLYDELRSADLSRPYPKFSEVNALPYLDACVWEGVRMHPPFALPFERIVRDGGITVLGHYLPAGTVIGGSPYVVNRHKGTFGQDAEFWRPERWLEQDEKHKLKLQRSVLTFGAGRRVCIGKHIGLMEVKKLVAFLVLNYNLHIIDPKAFQVENAWFFRQKGLNARVPSISTE